MDRPMIGTQIPCQNPLVTSHSRGANSYESVLSYSITSGSVITYRSQSSRHIQLYNYEQTLHTYSYYANREQIIIIGCLYVVVSITLSMYYAGLRQSMGVVNQSMLATVCNSNGIVQLVRVSLAGLQYSHGIILIQTIGNLLVISPLPLPLLRYLS